MKNHPKQATTFMRSLLSKAAPWLLLSLMIILSGVHIWQDVFEHIPEVRVYGPESRHPEKMVLLEVEKFNDYESLCDRVDTLVCRDSTPVLVLLDGKIEKQIPLINYCPEKILGRMDNVNRLNIQDDFCFHGSITSIDSLSEILYQYIFNPKNREDFSERPDHAVILLDYKKKGIMGLSNFLRRMTKASEMLKLKPYLNILLKTRYFEPPPPPPPPDHNY
jgi:hypothetical protein